MAYALKQALPGPAPAAAVAPPWVNPYQAGLDEQTAAMNAPQAPMYTEEQARDRKDANRRASRWGLLGLMMGDEGQQKAGGQVLQQALQARQERVTDKGVFDPVSGQMVVNPEYARERTEGRQQRLQDFANRAQETHDAREDTQAFQRQSLQEQIAARREQAQLQREAMGANKAAAADQKNMSIARQFNEDWQKVNKDDLGIRSSFQNLSSLPSTPAGDISFVYNWMKAQDPNSTVREGEFATAAKAGSLGTQIQNMVGQISSGRMLTPEQRAGMLGSAKSIVDQAESRIASRNSHYDMQARHMGVDPSLIVPEYGRTTGELAARNAPADAAGGNAPPPLLAAPGGGARPRVTDAASYAALPSGAVYIDPNGKVKTKGQK